MSAHLKLFGSLGEQLVSIVNAQYQPGSLDRRLLEVNAAITGAGTMPLSDGGFMIQQDYATEVFEAIYNEGELIKRCSEVKLRNGAQSLTLPAIIDKSRQNGARFGATQVLRMPEGGTNSTASRRRLGKIRFETTKLTGVQPVTRELLRDATSLEFLIRQGFTKEASFIIDLEILSGSGSLGECLGILNSGSLITVSKEANQAAETIVPQNVVNMFSRMHVPSMKDAVWLINPDIIPELMTMTLPTSNSNSPMYTAPNEYSPYGYLLGRPIVPVEACETVGTSGDIVLADLSQYALVKKEEPNPEFDLSLHVYFLADEMAFRFRWFINGQSLWDNPLTPYRGTTTRSPFVALEDRS